MTVAARSFLSATGPNRQTSGLQNSKQSGLKKSWQMSTSATGSTPTESNYQTSCLYWHRLVGVINARDRAERSQKALSDIEQLMAVDGSKKIVKLEHDAEGRTQGAIVLRIECSWWNGDFATVIVKYAAKTVTLIDLPFSQT